MRLLSRLLLIVLLTVIALVPAGAQTQTIAAAVAANADLSTLFTVLATSGLLEAMDSPDVELTLFAPTNVAFDAVPSEALEALQADPGLLMRVLTYHVVEANLASGDLLTAASAPTLVVEALEDPGMGGELAFTAGGDSLLVNGVHIITADIAASNGVIHVIDAVLFPPEVAEMLGMEPAGEPQLIVAGTLNPGGLENDGLFVTDAALLELSVTTDFTDIASIESAAFGGNGGIYITVDLAIGEDGVITAGGLLYNPGFISDGFSEVWLVSGENSGIIAPKGLQVLETLGVVAIADQGAKNVKLFSLDAEPDDAPTAVLSIGEGGSVWDVWYDLINDTLYAAKTNGDLIAYDFFSETLGVGGPDRIITPTDADGNKISINLHGIEIDYDSNTVILTDVGDATVNTDGQIFLMRAVSISDGPTAVDARIFGDQTRLGNPVDVIFDGAGIYVAEKANDLLMYYADILFVEGDLNAPATIAVAATKVEAVAIFPTRESTVIEEMGLME